MSIKPLKISRVILLAYRLLLVILNDDDHEIILFNHCFKTSSNQL